MPEEKSVNLPLRLMPDCWQDDAKMNALFAPFRKRETNPQGWNSKMSFWIKNVDIWCKENDRCVFTVVDVQQAFSRNGRKPQCISTVVNEMLRNGIIKLMSDLMSAPQQQTWASWALNSFVKSPLIWSFNKLKDSLISPSENTTEAEYVHLAVVKGKGETLILASDSETKINLFEAEQLKEVMNVKSRNPVSDKIFHLVIHWLHTQNLASVVTRGDVVLVKLATGKNQMKPITEADEAVFSLQQNERLLTKNIEQLELEKQQAEEEARNYLQRQMRQSAKSCLRKKKELEKCIEKRAVALDNVLTLLSRIREAESDSKILESYKMGLSALKTTFKEAGLTEDSVSDTMNSVQEVLDIHDEIQAALSEPVAPSTDADLEKELSALLLDNLPNPPCNSPKQEQTNMRISDSPVSSDIRPDPAKNVKFKLQPLSM